MIEARTVWIAFRIRLWAPRFWAQIGICVALGCDGGSSDNGSVTEFVAVGHTRGFYLQAIDLFAKTSLRINQAKPKYVFTLGDMTPNGRASEVALFRKQFLDRLEAPLLRCGQSRSGSQAPQLPPPRGLPPLRWLRIQVDRGSERQFRDHQLHGPLCCRAERGLENLP